MNEFIEIRNRIAALIEKYKYMLSRYDFLDEQKKNIINSCGNLDDDSVKFNLESVDLI